MRAVELGKALTREVHKSCNATDGEIRRFIAEHMWEYASSADWADGDVTVPEELIPVLAYAFLCWFQE